MNVTRLIAFILYALFVLVLAKGIGIVWRWTWEKPAPVQTGHSGANPGNATETPQETHVDTPPLPLETACIVPNIQGLDETAANRAISHLGLQSVKSVQHDPKISAGIVLSQEPAAGKKLLPCQGEVIMVISLGTLESTKPLPYASDDCSKPSGTTTCCCFVPYHIHDLGQVFPTGTKIRIQWKAGTPFGSCSGGNTLFSVSTHSLSWDEIGRAPIAPRQGVDDKIHREEIVSLVEFRYVKVEVPNCYNDYSSAEVNWPRRAGVSLAQGTNPLLIGCFHDQGDSTGTRGRDLNGFVTHGPSMTTATCINECRQRGFTYAGMQYSSWCFCGNSYGRSGTANNCNMPCSGSPAEICGGSWANSVYGTSR